MTSITIGGNSNDTKLVFNQFTKLVLTSSEGSINTSTSSPSHAAPDKLVNYMVNNDKIFFFKYIKMT